MRRVIGFFSTAAILLFLFACSQAKESSARGGQKTPVPAQSALHSFKCHAPDLTQGVVKVIQFDGERQSEEKRPYVGNFFASAVTFNMRNGTAQKIQLNDPINFVSEKLGRHDGCKQFSWHKAGPIVFVTFWGTGGNPYPPQQVLFLDEASQTLMPIEKLHPLVGRDFVEFEKDGCLAELRHGDGLVMRTCFKDSTLVLKNVLLEESYQTNAWHSFLCDFSDDRVDVAEYRVKSGALDDTAELDGPGSRQKMLSACGQFLKKFNEQVVPRERKHSAN